LPEADRIEYKYVRQGEMTVHPDTPICR
jgi:hypothetical protein